MQVKIDHFFLKVSPIKSLYEGPKMRNLQMTMITAVDLLNECALAHSEV